MSWPQGSSVSIQHDPQRAAVQLLNQLTSPPGSVHVEVQTVQGNIRLVVHMSPNARIPLVARRDWFRGYEVSWQYEKPAAGLSVDVDKQLKVLRKRRINAQIVMHNDTPRMRSIHEETIQHIDNRIAELVKQSL